MPPTTIARHEAAHPVREQLEHVSTRGGIIAASGGNYQGMALFSRERWAAWVGFLRDERLAFRPEPPVTLRRLGPTGDWLAVIPECRDVRN